MRAPLALRSQSGIADSDGSVLGQLDDEQGVLTAETVRDPARKRYSAQSSLNGWRQPGNWAARHVIIRPNLRRPAVVCHELETVAGGRPRHRRAVRRPAAADRDGDGI
jgi:hypothetical protein